MSGITLNATQQSTLLSLQQVTTLFNSTQTQLNSGKKVNSASDNAVAFFRSQSLYDRASDILNKKSTIDQNIQAVQSALTATSAVTTLLQQLQGVLEGARGASSSQRAAATVQFKNIGQQLAQLVKDASYNGLDILTSTNSSLSTQFSERTAATFTISGYNLTSTATGNANSLFTAAIVAFQTNGAINFSNVVASTASGSGTVTGFSSLALSGTSSVSASQAAAIFTAADNRISSAITNLRAVSAALGTNVAILQARAGFATDYATALSTGGDKLTLADLNAAAANSQALTLRQQLGIQSLSVSGTQNQSILTLLR